MNPDESKTKLIKNYRIKNSQWQCRLCDVFCNSQTQFEVHMISQKHKLIEVKKFSSEDNSYNSSDDVKSQNGQSCDENNNLDDKPKIDIHNFSLAESHGIKAHNYLIPESKRMGKFEKFGFYCSKCNAYMTGQIQLVMHVKGAKHQYYSPGEIPNYSPPKAYNPGHKSKFNRVILPEPIGPRQVKRNIAPCSTPIKAPVNGTYMDYLIKNQNMMQNQYYPRCYNYQSPVYNQYQSYNSPATNGNFYGQYQTSPQNLVPYQIAQPYRIFPSQSNLIVVKNDNHESKASSYSSNSDCCLNRSFEKNYPAYQNYDSPVFNVQTNSNQYTNQSPHQLFYSNKSNGFLFNNEPSQSTSPQLNMAFYQNYSIIS